MSSLAKEAARAEELSAKVETALADTAKSVARLVAERDRLLAACEAAEPYVEKRGDLPGGSMRREAVLSDLRVAIAYAKGSALCCLCSQPVGDEWRGHYVGPVHLRCASDASRDG